VTASTSTFSPHLFTPLRCLGGLLLLCSQSIALFVALSFALQIGSISSLAFLFTSSPGIGWKEHRLLSST
jgi:hypothetical protein